MRNLINILDFSVEEIDRLIDVADDIIKNPESYSEVCRHKILATLFYEPSTRTRLSFESAMLSLGGSVLGFSEAGSSSASKGESVADTAAMVSAYSDIVVMRHPKEGAPIVAAQHSSVPVINAGDGGHYHPTQTLTDLMTIRHEKGRLDNLTIGLCGDLKFGRTVHSLISAMSRYSGVKFVLISPEELRLPGFVKYEYIEKKGIEFVQCQSLEEAIPSLDVLYMTRIQRERFVSDDEYLRLKDTYILTEDKMRLAGSDMIVMHPLPRVNEISVAVDSDSRACYFKQARYGRYIRMALIMKLLGLIKDDAAPAPRESEEEIVYNRFRCRNTRCITSVEQELVQAFKLTDKENGIYRCVYCETRQN